MRRFILLTLLFFSYLMCFSQEGLKKIDFFIGKWDIETIDIQQDGSFSEGRALSEVKYILNGEAIQDDFLVLNSRNDIVFRGISIRSFNARTNKFQIVWIMPGYSGLTDIEAEWINGKLVSTGKGYDQAGEFLERFEYYDITENSYSFKMDRSYDGGNSWVENFGRMNATRIE